MGKAREHIKSQLQGKEYSGESGWDRLFHIQSKELKAEVLKGQGLSDEDIQGLALFLKKRRLPRCRAELALSKMAVLPLRELNLGMNNFGNVGIRVLMEALLDNFVHIRKLCLEKNRIGSGGAEPVAAFLERAPAPLEELHLSHNYLGKKDIQRLLLAAAHREDLPIRVPSGRKPLWLRVEKQLDFQSWSDFTDCEHRNWSLTVEMLCDAERHLVALRRRLGFLPNCVEAKLLCSVRCHDRSCTALECQHMSQHGPIVHLPYFWHQGPVFATSGHGRFAGHRIVFLNESSDAAPPADHSAERCSLRQQDRDPVFSCDPWAQFCRRSPDCQTENLRDSLFEEYAEEYNELRLFLHGLDVGSSRRNSLDGNSLEEAWPEWKEVEAALSPVEVRDLIYAGMPSSDGGDSDYGTTFHQGDHGSSTTSTGARLDDVASTNEPSVAEPWPEWDESEKTMVESSPDANDLKSVLPYDTVPLCGCWTPFHDNTDLSDAALHAEANWIYYQQGHESSARHFRQSDGPWRATYFRPDASLHQFDHPRILQESRLRADAPEFVPRDTQEACLVVQQQRIDIERAPRCQPRVTIGAPDELEDAANDSTVDSLVNYLWQAPDFSRAVRAMRDPRSGLIPEVVELAVARFQSSKSQASTSEVPAEQLPDASAGQTMVSRVPERKAALEERPEGKVADRAELARREQDLRIQGMVAYLKQSADLDYAKKVLLHQRSGVDHREAREAIARLGT